MSDRQMTLAVQADSGFEKYRKPIRRDVFLTEMDKVVPWQALCEQIEPVYPKGQPKGGCRPIGLERMLRIHFLHQWFNLSDPAVQEALYDSQAMRKFVGIDLGREAVPDLQAASSADDSSARTHLERRMPRDGLDTQRCAPLGAAVRR